MAELDTKEQHASMREVLSWAISQIMPFRRQFIIAWVCLFIATVDGSAITPLIFATMLNRVATLPRHATLWHTFGTLLILYGVALVVGEVCIRIAGWKEWGASLQAFAANIDNAVKYLLSLSWRWHIDHSSGETSSSLTSASWALPELIDGFFWEISVIVISLMSALVVLAIVIYPVALVMLGVVIVFIVLSVWRMKKIVSTGERFTRIHAEALGTITDVISNMSTVMAYSEQHNEQEHISGMVSRSVEADLETRKVHSDFRLTMSSITNTMTWVALFVGITLALHHNVAAGTIYLTLLYATQVSNYLSQSFDTSRSVGSCLAKATTMVSILGMKPDVVDVDDAPDIHVAHGRIEFKKCAFCIPTRATTTDRF